MKCAIVLADGIKQIMLSPENTTEKQVLKLLGEPNQEISIDFKTGTFYEGGIPQSAHGFIVQECRGNYYRAFAEVDSLMLVLRPKREEKKECLD